MVGSVRRGQVGAGISREGQGGHPVVVGHEEDASSAADKEREHGQEADPVQHTAHQEPLFILLRVGGRVWDDQRWYQACPGSLNHP